MTREEQLDALAREALQRLDQKTEAWIPSAELIAFRDWLRAEFMRTQAP